jgi:hypothetical protein
MMAGAVWAQSSKPVPGSPAPAVKPATIPAAKAAPAAAKPSSAPGQHNQLQRVSVVESADAIRIEISSSSAVTPRVSKLSSPARVLVELPGTVMASSQNKIPVGNAGVKGVRIGMDGKTPPTTSVVVDLEKAVAYELTPGPADKLVLTLHTQSVAKTSPAPVKTPASAAQPQTVAKNAAPAAKPQSVAAKPAVAATPQAVAVKPAAAAKPQAAAAKPAVTATPQAVAVKPPASAKPQAAAAKPVVAGNAAAPKAATTKIAAQKVAAQEPKAAASDKSKPGADAGKKAAASPAPKPQERKWAMNGKRDPFFSPVVQQGGGSGCSTGKKCLEIGAINLRGVVKSDSGFIAVVTNSLNKAYFLRENDPVFNGYVVKITGDSVVFQETVQDKLGKAFTREVVKRIFTPAV